MSPRRGDSVLLRRWAQLTSSEQLELELKLAVARRESGFRWPIFCYDNQIRQWSLRAALDPHYRGSRLTAAARLRHRRTMQQIHHDARDAALRRPLPDPASLTAAVLGDPLPGRSALDRDGPARLWQPSYSISAERKAIGQGLDTSDGA